MLGEMSEANVLGLAGSWNWLLGAKMIVSLAVSMCYVDPARQYEFVSMRTNCGDLPIGLDALRPPGAS